MEPLSVVYLPTGDGMCIALLDTATLRPDIHLAIAQNILGIIWRHNQSITDELRKFAVRIGINQSEDDIVKDIYGKDNVTGAGINTARRIMDLADESQILVSYPVYAILQPREKYYANAFRKFPAVTVKHGVQLDVFQLIKEGVTGLNTDPPSSLVIPDMPEPKLTKLSAYYFAHAIKNEKFILAKAREEGTYCDNWLKLLLWFLAADSKARSETTSRDVAVPKIMPSAVSNSDIDEQFEWFYDNVPADVAIHLSHVVVDDAVPSSIRFKCFDPFSDKIVVNRKGRDKLKTDWPEIWDEFGLGELSG